MANFRKRGEKWYYTLTWTDDKGKYHKSERIGGLTKADCQKAWREAMKQIDTTGYILVLQINRFLIVWMNG